MIRELRTVALTAEMERREAADDQVAGMHFTGHAAVFEEKTWIGPARWGFYEIIARGAFDDVLDEDTAFLINHDPNILLARNGNTMTLATDSTGLLVEADWDPADPEAVMWAGRVRRKDLTKMSFAFECKEDEWEVDDQGVETRTVLKYRHLFDVSPVVYPAYTGTDAEVNNSAAEIVKRHRGFDPRTTDTRPAQRSGSVLSRDQQRHRHLAHQYGLPRA